MLKESNKFDKSGSIKSEYTVLSKRYKNNYNNDDLFYPGDDYVDKMCSLKATTNIYCDDDDITVLIYNLESYY